MAELKEEHDFLYEEIIAETKKEDVSLPKKPAPKITLPPEVVVNPGILKKLKRVSKLEKIMFSSLVILTLITSFLIMNMGNKITQTRENTIEIGRKNQVMKENIEQLNQEKSELSSAKKVKEVAQKKGLTLKEDNVRNVK